MVNADEIRPHTPVVGSNGKQIAVVDHLEGTDLIKLAKDSAGVHHYIPVDRRQSLRVSIGADVEVGGAAPSLEPKPNP